VVLYCLDDGGWGVLNDLIFMIYVLKLTSVSMRFIDLYVNEFVCFCGAELLGLCVVYVELVDFGGVKMLVFIWYDWGCDWDGRWFCLY